MAKHKQETEFNKSPHHRAEILGVAHLSPLIHSTTTYDTYYIYKHICLYIYIYTHTVWENRFSIKC